MLFLLLFLLLLSLVLLSLLLLLIPMMFLSTGIDCEASRNREEQRMLEDAQHWLTTQYLKDRPHPKTGATALHVAAAKGYIKVLK